MVDGSSADPVEILPRISSDIPAACNGVPMSGPGGMSTKVREMS
jgi:hypothetical protein